DGCLPCHLGSVAIRLGRLPAGAALSITASHRSLDIAVLVLLVAAMIHAYLMRAQSKPPKWMSKLASRDAAAVVHARVPAARRVPDRHPHLRRDWDLSARTPRPLVALLRVHRPDAAALGPSGAALGGARSTGDGASPQDPRLDVDRRLGRQRD